MKRKRSALARAVLRPPAHARSRTPSAVRGRYDLLANVTTEIIFWSDEQTRRIIDANGAALRAYGYTLEELRALSLGDLRPPSARASLEEQLDAVAVARGTAFETRHIRKNGDIFPVELIARSAPVGGRRILVSLVRDITERRKAAHHAERLTELWRLATDSRFDEEGRLQAMLDASAAAMRPEGNVVARLSHLSGSEIVIDAVVRDAPTSGARAAAAKLDPPGTRLPCEDVLEADLIAAPGVVGWSDLAHSPTAARRVHDSVAGWKGALGCAIRVGELTYALLFLTEKPTGGGITPADEAFVDILASFFGSRLQQSRLRRQLRHTIEHDRLTALPNRALLRKTVNRALADDGSCALALIDIDAFREVNDVVGHQRADAVLVEIAHAMRRKATAGETVARLDGDTFGVFLCEADRATAAERVAELRAVFARPFGTGDREGRESVRVTAAIGVALSPQDGARFEDLLANAAAALEAAKGRGRGMVAFFDPEIKYRAERRRTLRAELRAAIDAGQFEMYYQPTVSLRTMRATGVEALIRWNHPTRGLLSPEEFIPFAQTSAAIGEIDRWVVERTIADLRSLPDIEGSFRWYCNVSAGSIGDDDFTARLAALLAESPASAKRLGVEITESAAMRDVTRTSLSLAALRDLGITVAIDDFGTGYSSLAYLTRFPVDVIKIDRSFVQGIFADPRDRTLIRTLLAMATELGFATVAEGVESEAELGWLRGTTCTMVQGYLIARPMSLDGLRTWLARTPFEHAGKRTAAFGGRS